MTREIKFKAWFIKDKVFIDTYFEAQAAHYDNGVVELLQFTGLHDKNGKEIYEGDIIRGGVAGKGFENQLPMYIVEYIPGAILPRGLNHPDVWWTVIGNIYENPELLSDGERGESNER